MLSLAPDPARPARPLHRSRRQVSVACAVLSFNFAGQGLRRRLCLAYDLPVKRACPSTRLTFERADFSRMLCLRRSSSRTPPSRRRPGTTPAQAPRRSPRSTSTTSDASTPISTVAPNPAEATSPTCKRSGSSPSSTSRPTMRDPNEKALSEAAGMAYVSIPCPLGQCRRPRNSRNFSVSSTIRQRSRSTSTASAEGTGPES